MDHRSLAAQGIELAAGVHLGPNVVRMESRGLRTDRGDAGREIEKQNEEVRRISAKILDLAEARKRIEAARKAEEQRRDTDLEILRSVREANAKLRALADETGKRIETKKQETAKTVKEQLGEAEPKEAEELCSAVRQKVLSGDEISEQDLSCFSTGVRRWIGGEQKRQELERKKLECKKLGRWNQPETVDEAVARAKEDARAGYRWELIRRGEWEPFECPGEREAVKAAGKKAEALWGKAKLTEIAKARVARRKAELAGELPHLYEVLREARREAIDIYRAKNALRGAVGRDGCPGELEAAEASDKKAEARWGKAKLTQIAKARVARKAELKAGEEPSSRYDTRAQARREASDIYCAKNALRGVREPGGCRGEWEAAEAAEKKADAQRDKDMETWKKRGQRRAKAAKIAERKAEREALEQKFTALPQERQEWVEQYFPVILEQARQQVERLKQESAAILEQTEKQVNRFQQEHAALEKRIKAHVQARPEEPEQPNPPKKPLFGYARPSKRARYEQDLEQYGKAKATCEAYEAAFAEWEKEGEKYEKQRREAARQIGLAQDKHGKQRLEMDRQIGLAQDVLARYLGSNPKDQSSPLWREAANRAKVDDPKRWDKIERDVGSARDWHKLATQKGCYHVIGDLLNADQILIAEGYGTAASVYEITGRAVVVALDSWNLQGVAKALHETYPAKHITILGDDDRLLVDRNPNGLPNVGREKAEEAAREVGGTAIFPYFLESEKGAEFTDFGDLARSQGLDAVKSRVEYHFELLAARAEKLKHEQEPAIEEQELEKRRLERDWEEPEEEVGLDVDDEMQL